MIEHDTVRLLRECDAGIKMGISAIEEVLGDVRDEKLKELLTDGLHDHEEIRDKLQALLTAYHDDGKDPNPVAKGMSWIKTNAKLAVDASDATIAGLMTDGCDMGVKSLSGYLNQYKAADEKSKDLTKKLIALEERMSKELRAFL